MEVHQADAHDGPRCSTLSGRLGEPLAGSASYAPTWLCVEQPGPWGHDALKESHLDPNVGRELVERSAGTGVRVVLIRRPGSHPDRHRPVPRHVYLAHTAPGRTWLERAWVSDPKELLDLDFAAAGAGMPAGIGQLVTEPLLLMCTNGRRDVCCALLGRPIADALVESQGEHVWECTHIGGHRFAPTGLTLPNGYSYGRLDLAWARRLLLPGAGVLVDLCRGRSTWQPAGQAAELAVRLRINDVDPDALTVSETEPLRPIVSHVDGRRWAVTVAERTATDPRSQSCEAAPRLARYLEVEEIQPVPPT